MIQVTSHLSVVHLGTATMTTPKQVVLAVLVTALLCGADMTLARSVAKRSVADGEYLLSIFLNKMSQV